MRKAARAAGFAMAPADEVLGDDPREGVWRIGPPVSESRALTIVKAQEPAPPQGWTATIAGLLGRRSAPA